MWGELTEDELMTMYASEAAVISDAAIKIAQEARFRDELANYRLNRYNREPEFHARKYLECVNEYGAGSRWCKRDKEVWLKRKAAHNGNKVAWNEEEVHKMLKEDAIKGGYKEGYFLKKDPMYLEYAAIEYEKCIAKHGAKSSLCNSFKRVWLKAKAYQSGN